MYLKSKKESLDFSSIVVLCRVGTCTSLCTAYCSSNCVIGCGATVNNLP